MKKELTVAVGALFPFAFVSCNSGGESNSSDYELTEQTSVLRHYQAGDELVYSGILLDGNVPIRVTRTITEPAIQELPPELQGVSDLKMTTDRTVAGSGEEISTSLSLFDQSATGSLISYAGKSLNVGEPSVESEWVRYTVDGVTPPTILQSPLKAGYQDGIAIQGTTSSGSGSIWYEYRILEPEVVQTQIGTFEAYPVEATRDDGTTVERTKTWYYPAVGKVKVRTGQLEYTLVSTNFPHE